LAQRQLVRLLDDKSKFVQTDGGKVVLDLRPIMIQIGDQRFPRGTPIVGARD